MYVYFNNKIYITNVLSIRFMHNSNSSKLCICDYAIKAYIVSIGNCDLEFVIIPMIAWEHLCTERTIAFDILLCY